MQKIFNIIIFLILTLVVINIITNTKSNNIVAQDVAPIETNYVPEKQTTVVLPLVQQVSQIGYEYFYDESGLLNLKIKTKKQLAITKSLGIERVNFEIRNRLWVYNIKLYSEQYDLVLKDGMFFHRFRNGGYERYK